MTWDVTCTKWAEMVDRVKPREPDLDPPPDLAPPDLAPPDLAPPAPAPPQSAAK